MSVFALRDVDMLLWTSHLHFLLTVELSLAGLAALILADMLAREKFLTTAAAGPISGPEAFNNVGMLGNDTALKPHLLLADFLAGASMTEAFANVKVITWQLLATRSLAKVRASVTHACSVFDAFAGARVSATANRKFKSKVLVSI